MPTAALLCSYLILIVLTSLSAGWLPALVHLTHRRMEIAVSAVAGFMLGAGVLQLLPEALHRTDAVRAAHWLLAGFLAMFFIERFFCFHHHDVPAVEPAAACAVPDADPVHRHQQHELTWGGAAVGLTLHSLIDGLALAAAVHADAAPGHGPAGWAGLAIFLLILLHKPFDSLTLGTLMAVGGWRIGVRQLVNIAFALAVPLGASLFHLGLRQHGDGGGALIGAALAFSTGTFLCIALSDLLPELQFHRHDRLALSLALLVGLGLAWTIGRIHAVAHEPRDHEQPAAPALHAEQHDAEGHGSYSHP